MDAPPVWVLGGGLVGIAPGRVGILTRLGDEGVTVSPDAVVIGTGAGAQMTSGVPLPDPYGRHWDHLAQETAAGPRFGDLLKLARARLFARGPSRPRAASAGLRSPHASRTRPGNAASPRPDCRSTPGRTRTCAS